MCGTISGGKRHACSASFSYTYPYGHHNVQSFIHTVAVPHSISLFTFFNGSSSEAGNTLLSTAQLPTGYRNSGYRKVRQEGWIFPANATQAQLPPGASLSDMQPLNMWRKPAVPVLTCAGADSQTGAVCVADADWVHGRRALPHTAWLSRPSTTQQSCAMACHTAGFAFSGVEAGSACFCGPVVPKTKKVRECPLIETSGDAVPETQLRCK
jgi:hypothetical protein